MRHRNAPLTQTGRLRLVRLVEDEGLTFEAAAAASNVAKSTAWEWVRRWREASAKERASLACLEDRSSRPRRSPRQLSEQDHDRICSVRRRTGWGPRLIATEVEIPHATVHRALRRRHMSRRPRPERGEVVRYEWPCPGDLVHMDVKRFARFTRPGHAKTGDRFRTGQEKRMALATSSPTRRSTTTRAWPTPSSTKTSAPPPSPPSPSGRSPSSLHRGSPSGV
jgi:transposase